MAAVATLTPQGYFSDLTHMSVSSPSTRTTMSIETSSTSPTRTTSLYSPNFGFRLQYDHPDSDREDDIIPKVEELDEDEDIEAKLALIPESTTETFGEPLVSPTTVKRPRGRPRKHPISPPTSVAKITKGRSKTGCLTCRRRKKKCDETKPHCLNCQKNAVVCEGYPERQLWKSGKQKAQEGKSMLPDVSSWEADRACTARRYSSGGPSSSLPCLIDGVETDIDRRFLDHFVHDVSRILTLFADDSNPFKEILLPMAMRHRGLMHSLLCLAGSHLASRENTPVYNERQMYHFDRAVSNLRTDRKIEAHISGSDDAPIDDPSVAQTLIFALQTICEGKTNGEYRPHMDATRHLVMTQKTQNSAFGQFLYEFFTYHDVSNAITSLDRRPLMMTEDFVLPQFIVQPEAGAMLGVLDGLFAFISKITNLRDKIRKRRTGLMEPQVDYETLSEAVAIDNAIHTWVPPQQEGTIRYIASQLYRQATWVYLYRTIQPSAPSSKIREAVDQGLAYLRMLPSEGSTQSILLMPLFLLGCAAFEDDQRPDISDAFVGLKEYSQLGNIAPAREIVERVWSMMDAGDDRSWDWETIIKEMGYDFLVT